MDRTKRLLEAGYFPSQLPPAFVTHDLAAHCANFYAQWLALQGKSSKGKPVVPKAPECKLEHFSVARTGHLRRATNLPNPVAQTYRRSHLRARNWKVLEMAPDSLLRVIGRELEASRG